MKISGIYKIQSKIHPDRIYIGSAVNLYNRWAVHKHLLKNNKHDNPRLQAHYNKYGKDDLIFGVVVVCDKEQLMPINKVVWIEQCFIWVYKPSFNICRIAGNCMGRSVPKDVAIRISNTLKGNIPWNKGTAKPKVKKPRLTPIMAFKSGHKPWNKGKHTHPYIQKMLRDIGLRCSVCVLQYDREGNLIKEWNSFAMVQRELGISASNAVQCAKGRVKSAGGFIWKYKDVA